MEKLTEFGKKIKFALIAMGESQKWLIGAVSNRTGLFFDQSYLRKIMIGQNNNQKIINAIATILNIETE